MLGTFATSLASADDAALNFWMSWGSDTMQWKHLGGARNGKLQLYMRIYIYIIYLYIYILYYIVKFLLKHYLLKPKPLVLSTCWFFGLTSHPYTNFWWSHWRSGRWCLWCGQTCLFRSLHRWSLLLQLVQACLGSLGQSDGQTWYDSCKSEIYINSKYI